jgi:hypothetical protein
MTSNNTSRVRINPRDTKTPPKGQDSRVRINPRDTNK